MSPLEITCIAVAVIAFVFVIALGVAAKRGDDHGPIDPEERDPR